MCCTLNYSSCDKANNFITIFSKENFVWFSSLCTPLIKIIKDFQLSFKFRGDIGAYSMC
jgi:hypothetical protein